MSTIDAWYYDLPPFTKVFLTASVGATILSTLGIIHPMYYILSVSQIFYKFEIWRILTPFLYFGNLDFGFLMTMGMLVRFTRPLETMPMFLNNPASFYWGMIFIIICLLGLGSFCGLMLLGDSLIFTMIYIWSKYEPDVIVPFYWGFQVKGYQLPFFFMGIIILLGGSILNSLIGLVAGEAFYLLKEKVPQDYGWDVLSPPNFFYSLIERFKKNRPNQPQAGFAGRGYRLG